MASPAYRTRESTDIVCGVLSHPLDTVVWEPAVYNASLETLLDVVVEHSAEGNLLVVGHNPGVTYLMEYLCGAGSARRGLGTGRLARLSLPARRPSPPVPPWCVSAWTPFARLPTAL